LIRIAELVVDAGLALWLALISCPFAAVISLTSLKPACKMESTFWDRMVESDAKSGLFYEFRTETVGAAAR